MTSQELLGELEGLSHDGRQRRMMELGRESLASNEVGEVLQRFGRGGFYLRSLALAAIHGSRDGERLLAFLRDASTGLRRKALNLIPLICTDEQVRRGLADLTQREQRDLLLSLRRRRRQGVVDTALQALADSEAEHLRGVFGLASAELVGRLGSSALKTARPLDWKRFARTHPELASTALQQRATQERPENGRVRTEANAVLVQFGKHQQAAAALPLLQTLLDAGHSAETLVWQPCYAQRAEATLDLLLRHQAPLANQLVPRAQLRDEQFVELLRRGWAPAHHRWLRKQTPQRRQAAYLQAADGWRDARGFLAYDILRHLDEPTRRREVELIYSSTRHFVQPGERLRLAGLLPWDVAFAEAKSGLDDPEPAVRAIAISALVSATRYSPDRLPDMLTLLQQRKNEPDPVRYSWLEALALLPPGRWQPAHFKALAQVIRDSLEAADLSVSSSAALQKLLGRLLLHRPEWAAPWLARVVAHLGQVNPAALSAGLPAAALRTAGEELLPVLRSWQPRERHEQLFSLVHLLGPRSRHMPGLLELVAQVSGDPRGSDSGAAMDALAGTGTDWVQQLVPSLLQQDGSWILHPVVCAHVHRHRQDLLTGYLDNPGRGGRFASGETLNLLPVRSGFWRWTLEQQRQYSELLVAVTHDAEREQSGLARAVETLARLPALPPRRLLELASLQESRPAVRDVALRALARLDSDQGLDELVGALGDERARVAVYALRSRLLRMSGASALDLLRRVPTTRVTVAKEVMRLLGDLPDKAGLVELLSRQEQPLHRDVRIASLRALWNHLEDGRAWPSLEKAAQDLDERVSVGLADIPGEGLSEQSHQRWAELMATLLAHPSQRVRAATLSRLAHHNWHDAGGKLSSALADIVQTEHSTLYGIAMRAWVAAGAFRVEDIVRALLPRRQQLAELCDHLGRLVQRQAERWASVVAAVDEVLATDPLCNAMRLSLTASTGSFETLANRTEQMLRSDPWGIETLRGATAALLWMPDPFSPEVQAAAAARWAVHSDGRLRRLALELVLLGSRQRGWTDERRRELEKFREDADPTVATVAQFTFPP